MGALAVTSATTYGLYALYARIWLDRSPQGFTVLILMVVFLSGMILLVLGVIGEYVGRIYEQVKMRPTYVVEQVIKAED